MTKDEMKSRISMALKDPVLQQGFEIICKNLDELEKVCQDLSDKFDYQVKQVMKLEKENAELNKKLSKAEADYDKMFWYKK